MCTYRLHDSTILQSEAFISAAASLSLSRCLCGGSSCIAHETSTLSVRKAKTDPASTEFDRFFYRQSLVSRIKRPTEESGRQRERRGELVRDQTPAEHNEREAGAFGGSRERAGRQPAARTQQLYPGDSALFQHRPRTGGACFFSVRKARKQL